MGTCPMCMASAWLTMQIQRGISRGAGFGESCAVMWFTRYLGPGFGYLKVQGSSQAVLPF